MTQTALPLALPAIGRAATFSGDGRYRYSLDRPIPSSLEDPVGARLLFVMLNPSTADAHRDDPTIRRCLGFGRRWGYTHLTVANLYAWRATKPDDLFAAVDPIGTLNDAYLRALAGDADLIVCAWGSHGSKFGRGRKVTEMLFAASEERRPRARGWFRPPLYCLGTCKNGEPRHPLYVRGDFDLIPFG